MNGDRWGVTVHVPPERVWPWVRQLRDLPEPRPCDPMSKVAGRFRVGRVVQTAPGERLTVSVMGALMS